jgi:hypothetical protein
MNNEENYNHLYGEFQPSNDLSFEFIDKWMETDIFSQICEDADSGDEDSIEVIDELNSRIESLMFHIQNESGYERIAYEMNNIRKFVNSFIE